MDNLKVWVGKNEEGGLWMNYCDEDNYIMLPKDHPWGKGLAWEDEPRKLKLVDAQEQEYELAVLREMVDLFVSGIVLERRKAISTTNELETLRKTTLEAHRQLAESNVQAREKSGNEQR